MRPEMKRAIAIEKEEHPWADDEIARKLVEDHLRDDPSYYDGMEEEDDGDPYPEESPMPSKHGHGKPELVIAIGAGKPKKNEEEGDPYPED